MSSMEEEAQDGMPLMQGAAHKGLREYMPPIEECTFVYLSIKTGPLKSKVGDWNIKGKMQYKHQHRAEIAAILVEADGEKNQLITKSNWKRHSLVKLPPDVVYDTQETAQDYNSYDRTSRTSIQATNVDIFDELSVLLNFIKKCKHPVLVSHSFYPIHVIYHELRRLKEKHLLCTFQSLVYMDTIALSKFLRPDLKCRKLLYMAKKLQVLNEIDSGLLPNCSKCDDNVADQQQKRCAMFNVETLFKTVNKMIETKGGFKSASIVFSKCRQIYEKIVKIKKSIS